MISNAPFAAWEPDDHAGPIIIATTLCMLYYVLPGVLQQALSCAQSVPYTPADGLFSVSMVRRLAQSSRQLRANGTLQLCGITQSTLILAACHYGFGTSSSRVHDAANLLTAKKVRLGLPGLDLELTQDSYTTQATSSTS